MRLQSDFIIRRNSWDHLIATLERGDMKLTIDGAVLALPVMGSVERPFLPGAWTFEEMRVGKTVIGGKSGNNGIPGQLDQFHVDKLTEYGIIDDSSSMAVIPSFLLLFVLSIVIS